MKGDCKNGGIVVIICGLLLLFGYFKCDFNSTDGHRKIDPSEGFSDPQVVALVRAAQLGNIGDIDRLVAAGADVNAIGREGITPLFWAFVAQNKEGFRRLLEHKANPNVQTEDGNSVMNSVADFADDSEWLELALEHGGNPNFPLTKNRFVPNRTPIFASINKHNTKGVMLLVKAGADLGYKNHEGITPLEFAFHFRHYDIVYQLLLNGADYRAKSICGKDIASMIMEPDPFVKYADADSQSYRDKAIQFLKEKMAQEQSGED